MFGQVFFIKKLFKKIVACLVYFLILLIPFQIYIPIPVYKSKHVSLSIILAFLLFLVSFNIDKVKKFISEKSVLTFLLFLLFIFFRGIFDKDKLELLKYIVFLTSEVVLSYILVVQNVKKEKIITLLTISVLPLIFLMFYMYFNETRELEILKMPVMKIFIEPDTLNKMISVPWEFNIFQSNRVGGFFTNVNTCGMFLGFILLMGIHLILLSSENFIKKIMFSVFNILVLCCILFTGSKGALISLCVSLIGVSFLVSFRVYSGFKRIIFLIVSLVIILVMSILFINVSPRIKNFQDNDDFHGRKNIWLASVEVIKKNWLFGVGLDEDIWNQKYNIGAQKFNAQFNVPPHNIFLYIWGKAGILAFVLFFLFFIFKLYTSANNFLETINLYSLLSFSCTLWLFIQGMVENFPFMDIRVGMLYWVILSLER